MLKGPVACVAADGDRTMSARGARGRSAAATADGDGSAWSCPTGTSCRSQSGVRTERSTPARNRVACSSFATPRMNGAPSISGHPVPRTLEPSCKRAEGSVDRCAVPRPCEQLAHRGQRTATIEMGALLRKASLRSSETYRARPIAPSTRARRDAADRDHHPRNARRGSCRPGSAAIGKRLLYRSAGRRRSTAGSAGRLEPATPPGASFHPRVSDA